jgi:hypothetical protein
MHSPRGFEKLVPVPSASGSGRRREPSLAALVLLAALAAVPSSARAQDSATAEPVAAEGSTTAGDSAATEVREVAEAAAAPAEPVERRFSFDAFGTLGLVYSTEDRADFLVSTVRPDGPGHSESASPDPDSVLAGQMTYRVTKKLSAVVQAVAEQDADDDYDPDLEWAYLSFEPTPDLRLRAGRLVLPGFMVSEYRKVSYANPWVRPPVELYQFLPVFTIDGVDVSYRIHQGAWTSTYGLNLGRSEEEFPRGFGSAEAERAWNLNAKLQRGGFTARVAVASAALDIDALDPLFDGFRGFGPEGVAIAERFEVDETRFRFATGGLEYDPGDWFVIAEIGWLDTRSVLGEKIAGYVTAGRRFGALTSYATYSRSDLLSDTSHPGLPLDGLPESLVPVAAGLNAGLDELSRSVSAEQGNHSVGGRRDFATGKAQNLQVDFNDVREDSDGTFGNIQPGFERGGSAEVLSLATVFVF